MRYRYISSNCFRMIPVQLLDPNKNDEESGLKRIINVVCRMNEPYLKKGAGQTRVNPTTRQKEYFDVPHFSLKMYKRDGKIHQYVHLPKDEVLEQRLQQTLFLDVKSCRFVPDHLELPSENLFAFTIKGHHHLAIELEKEYANNIKSLFQMVGKDQLMYNLTLKEVEDHESKRYELTKRLAGINDVKTLILHEAKNYTKAGLMWLYNFLVEEETREKHKLAIDKIKAKLLKKEEARPLSKRKIQSDKNRFMMVEILFLLWTTNEEKAQRFKGALQKLLDEMKGENQLEVVEVKPDLIKVAKGRIHYDLPFLCLYQKELSKFLFLPAIYEMDDTFYVEHQQKTKIPQYALNYEVGALALGRKMDTGEIIAMPRAKTEELLDDRGTPTIISGKKGSGKTQLLINQVADTFCLGASSIEEWKEKARSVIIFDVADGEMLKEIYELVPQELKDRVIFLNHADLENPLPITNHDILSINKVDGFEEEIANMETEILMDSLKDKNSTVAIERYFKMALQASYIAGKGNIIDAMKIIENKSYRDKIIETLDADEHVFLPSELKKMDDIFSEPKALETIDNRISRLKNTLPWIDCLAQRPTEGMNFWKWMNGDKDGAYLVLIYIPKRMNKNFRSFLFAHYLMKIWYMTEAREIINKDERKEFLVVVDELHQIFGHRVVPIVLEAALKEARKYRGRYTFTIHGWSSIKDKEIKEIMRDSSGNYIMLKGGDDMFSSLEKEFRPYTVDDFNELMKMKYCGIFKVDIKKQTHVFMAKLMEPASIRFKKQRSIDLETFRAMKNKFGRPKKLVRMMMKKGGVEPCKTKEQQMNLEKELTVLEATIGGGV